MVHQRPHQQFTDALDALVAQVKTDRSVLAALLCGSLSHDTVWARSDIDLVLVTIDDAIRYGRGRRGNDAAVVPAWCRTARPRARLETADA